MRGSSFALISVVAGSLVAGAACSGQHFPQPLASGGAEGGASASDGGGDGSLLPLESAPPAFIGQSARASASSSPLVFDPARGGVWTANGDVGSVSYADVDRYALVGEIPVGKDIRSVALSPDGKWLAAVDRAGAQVALIDADARAVVRVIPTGTHPRAAIWDAADPRWLYVAVEDDNAVAVIDRTLGVLSSTIPVGRLPSGVAVSATRRELYVTHRIDGKVTIVPLTVDLDAGIETSEDAGAAGGGGDGGDDAAPAGPMPPQGPLSANYDVPLAYELGDGKSTTPHGTPFGFESLAWAADGNVAWLPHELLASTHPFQFQTMLFPTVSVVDLSQRAEVQTDPNDPNGAIRGRKNLFAAINVLDPTGNTEILSQPCAAAFHPNGNVAYVVACASEDLLTFDLTQGIAVDLVRGLPGDHPVGLALDTAGTRAFVLDDESEDPAAPAAPLRSKSLHVLNLAGGNLLAHVAPMGSPIGLVAKDPVDPDTRAGLRYFFRANSSKGAYATTGNFWISCGGCHLDGFVSTNEAFFEDMHPTNPSFDARIGHSGLVDFFSTLPPASGPGQPAFNPHDVLSAFEEQGGLAPDRSGIDFTGQVDASAPPADAAKMAAQVGKVFTSTLPLGPTWLIPDANKPNATYDGSWCGQCHQAEYAAWQKSAHAHAAVDPMVRFCANVEAKNNGNQYPRLCVGCHDPVSAEIGDTSFSSGRGITCLGCHDTERLIQAGGNADLQAGAYDWTVSHKARASAALDTLRSPLFCGGCHQQFVPGTGMEALNTLHEWQGSAYAGGTGGAFAPDAGTEDGGGIAPNVTRCVDCHVSVVSANVHDHSMIGGNVYVASQVTNDPTMTASVTANLKLAIVIESATRAGETVNVTVRNRGSGHAFPTGVTDIREPWIEIQAVDANHNPVAHYGGPADDGTIPADAARLGTDIASADGTVLYLHELSRSTRIPFARFVPPLGTVAVTVPAPSALPSGATGFDAVLYYRNVRTPFFRAASGSTTATAPQVEVARTAVQ